MSGDIHLRDGSPIRVIVRRNEVDGVIVSFSEGVLLVILERDPSPRIPLARTVSEDLYLLQRLRSRLQEVRARKAHFNREKAEQAVRARTFGTVRATSTQGCCPVPTHPTRIRSQP